jgi:hypothetical protein
MRLCKNLSLYRPGQAFRVPEVGVPRISRQSAHERAKVVNPTPQEILRVLISLRGIVRPKGLSEK